MRYDRIKVFVGNEFWAYLKPKDIADLKMRGEYRKRINPKDNKTVENIFVWDRGGANDAKNEKDMGRT